MTMEQSHSTRRSGRNDDGTEPIYPEIQANDDGTEPLYPEIRAE
jgi:hypothetical protein